MDLPPDKAKLLRQYEDHKKWEMICDQELVSAKDPPAHYLDKLKTYLDPKASRSSRVTAKTRDFIFKKTLFEKLQYPKQEQ